MSRRSARQSVIDEKHSREKEFMNCVMSSDENGLKMIDAGEKGRGVASTRPFKQGDFVARYVGDIISSKEAQSRYDSWNKLPHFV